jgi:hypothetical protein
MVHPAIPISVAAISSSIPDRDHRIRALVDQSGGHGAFECFGMGLAFEQMLRCIALDGAARRGRMN